MEGTFSRKLHVWNEASSVAEEPFVPISGPLQSEQETPLLEEASSEQHFALEALIPPGHKLRPKTLPEPYTLQWFLNVENQRYGRFGSWIPRLMEFHKHAGEMVLGLGMGLGTDWVQYARHAVNVTVCSPSLPQLNLIRRNFDLRNLKGRFLHTQLATLPLDSASVDVVAINAMTQSIESAAGSLDEIYRVLKPGGKVIAVASCRYDVDYWVHKVLVWRNWLGLNRRPYDASIVRYRRRELSRIFSQYIDQSIHRRQLRRAEVPHGWRWLPLPVLTHLAGRVLVLKAFKPLSVALPVNAAA